MRWSLRFALVAALLFAAALGLPLAFPPEEDYEYQVHTVADPQSESRNWTVVAYGNLSREERAVFDAARTGDGSVRRDERVNGSHYTHHTDVVGSVAVRYEGRTYAVHGWIVRVNFGVRYWGRPLLFLLGILAGVAALLAFGVRYARTR